ncbi:O-antigen/teichoic acid export membrane protein [Dysgonomonadaceae bacterium PH5-43]|nr:O-antigen/teichoic acid export membrane protein [Dysgonomonadaceae bacterium PH5-43]
MGIVIRQSIKGSLATYVGTIIGILTTLFIIPKYIGEELLGLTRVLFEAGVLFATIFQLGASSSVIKFFPYFKSKDKHNNGFFFYLIALVTVGFLLFVPAFLILKEPISNFFSEKSPLFVDYLYWVIPLTFFLLYWITFEIYSIVLMRIAIPKFIREIVVRLLLVVVYVLYALGFLNLTGFIVAFICVYGIVMMIAFFYISRIGSVSLKHDSKFITPSLKKDFTSYTSFLLIGSIGSSLVGKIDLFMISAEMSLAWAGIYSIAFYMANVIEIPSRSISAISAPIVAEALNKENYEEAGAFYKKVSLHQLLIGSSLFILIWINLDNAFAIIPNGEVYSSGKWVVLFIGLAKLVEMTFGFGGIMINFSKHYKWNLFFTFFITFVTIAFNALLIPRLGISGAAIATFITYIICFGLQQILVLVTMKVHPYSIGFLKILAVMFVAFGLNYILPTLNNVWIDSIYRTLIVVAVSGTLIYVLNISEEANNLIKSTIKKLKK